jgi:DNA-binding transcriptional MocR family regulator
VLSLGSFSKIVAPGLRLGWIQTDAASMRVLLASGSLVSGGNFNHFTSHVVRQLLENGELDSNIVRLRSSYAAGRRPWTKPCRRISTASRPGRSRSADIFSGSSCRPE